jgi:hypothetical protein
MTAGAGVPIDGDDIGRTVTGPNGPRVYACDQQLRILDEGFKTTS